MKILKKQNRKILTIASLTAFFLQTATADTMVNFTLSLNTAKDPGATYDNFSKAGDGIGTAFVIGFQVALNSVNGTNINLSPIAAFCSELQEDISATTYTFKAQDLSTLAVGQAGDPGTASSGIPIGGIGQQRAAYVNYLFDQYYISEALSEWTYTSAQPVTHAFQMALWELTHDDDFSITNSAGAIYVGTQTAGTATEITQRNNAIALAQSMLNTVYNANVSSSYISETFSLWALVDETGQGATGYQDVVLATKKGSSNDIVVEPLLPPPAIPEPTTHALITLSGAIILFINRLFRKNNRTSLL